MSLIYCPECSHEVSASAVACPNCGRPLAPPALDRKVVVMPPPEREGGFPNWAFIPIGLLALILIVVAFMAFRSPDDQANMNVNVNMAGRRTPVEPVRESHTATVPVPDSPGVAIPPPGQTTTVPGTSTSVPVPPPSDKGTVVINAKITTTNGETQVARNTKFYLLDRDVETILMEAKVQPIEGNSLMGSIGLASVYPDRYGDFRRSAMRAIAASSKYSGTTGGGGAASLADIAPEQYYLFAVVRENHGFALWNSPVAVVPGQNILNLSPQTVTEIPEPQ